MDSKKIIEACTSDISLRMIIDDNIIIREWKEFTYNSRVNYTYHSNQGFYIKDLEYSFRIVSGLINTKNPRISGMAISELYYFLGSTLLPDKTCLVSGRMCECDDHHCWDYCGYTFEAFTQKSYLDLFKHIGNTFRDADNEYHIIPRHCNFGIELLTKLEPINVNCETHEKYTPKDKLEDGITYIFHDF
jgi:hypothetical protein